MPVVSRVVATTPSKVSPSKPLSLEEKFSLAKDSLKQLPNYFSSIYSSQGKPTSKPLEEFEDELSRTLYTDLLQDPVKIITEPRYYIDKLKLHKADTLLSLIKEKPLLLIAHLTTDRGLYNIKTSPKERKGALSLLAVLAKQSEYRISRANKYSKELLEEVDVLMLVSKVLEKVQENDKGQLINNLSKIVSLMSDELGPIEIAAFNKASALQEQKKASSYKS